MSRSRVLPRDAAHAVIYAAALSAACLISYQFAVGLSAWWGPSGENAPLAGMWAVIATVVVFRLGYQDSVRAARSRGFATLMSLMLCLLWLLFLPPGLMGMVVLIGVGTAVLLLVDRPDEAVTTGVATTVVMVIAAVGPAGDAWLQPVLRTGDTAIGVVVGLAAAWCARRLGRLSRGTGSDPSGPG